MIEDQSSNTFLNSHHSRVDEIDKHVGKKLRNRRIMLGLSQQVLGEEVGVSIQQIQKYEKATNRVASGKLYQFAKLLEVPVAYFFEGLESLNKKSKTAFAENQAGFDEKDNLHERELLTLVRAFNDITEPSIRKKILDLVKTLSTS